MYLHFDEDPDAGALGVGRLMRHFMGASQDTDELVAEFPENPRLYVTPELTHDGRCLVLHISEGTSEKNRLWVCPVSTDSGAAIIGQPLRVVDEAYAGFRLVRRDRPLPPDRPRGTAPPGWSGSTWKRPRRSTWCRSASTCSSTCWRRATSWWPRG